MSAPLRLLVLGRIAIDAADRIRAAAPELTITSRGFDEATPADLERILKGADE